MASNVFLVHGTDAARNALKTVLEEKVASIRSRQPGFAPSFDVILATEGHRWFDLDRAEWTTDEANEHASLRAEVLRLRDENAKLRDRVRDLEEERAEATGPLGTSEDDPLLDRLVAALIPLARYAAQKRGGHGLDLRRLEAVPRVVVASQA